MATDDVSTMESTCPCGQGKIIVTQTMPDHPWVRASQIHYDGSLKCAACSKIYAIESSCGGTKPRMVLRSDLNAKAEATEKVRQAERALKGAPEIGIIKDKIIAQIDAEPSKAAKHRLLERLGVFVRSYGSFIKGPTDGHSILRYASDLALIEAGVRAKIPEAEKFKEKLSKIEELQEAVWAIDVKTIATGAHWMRA